MEPAQIVEHLLVQADDVCLQGRLLAEPANVLLHVLLGLLDDLLDSGRMNSPVLDQPFERDLGDLAADAVEAGDDDHAGRVVDDHVDAGRLLEGADVAPLAADDPPFHLVVGDVDRADGDFGGVRRGVALDRGGQDLAAFLLAGSREPIAWYFKTRPPISPLSSSSTRFEQQLAGVIGREAADALQVFELSWQGLA